MKIAYHGRPWGVRFAPAWTEIRKAGFTAVETFCLSQWFGNPDRFAAMLAESGLALAGMEFGGEWIVPERAAFEADGALRLAEFLAAVGARMLIASGGRRPPGGATAEDDAQLAETMNRLGAGCRERGIELCYHPKIGALVAYRDQIERMMESTDPESVGLCLDTGDLARAGCDPLEVYRTLKPRVRHVHLKDLDWFTHQPLVPGRGALELPDLLTEMTRDAYNGFVTIELEESEDPLADTVESRRFLFDNGF